MDRTLQPVRLGDAVRGFEGKWVAIKAGKVVEARETADAVYLALRDRAVRGATIMRIPARDEPELVGLG
jgi:Family of unknown function (DUF5678)